MSVTITERAATEMQRFLSDRNMAADEHVLRVAVAGGGCSGFEYKLAIDKSVDEANDLITEQHGLRVAVDKRSLLYLDGTTVDYHDGLEQRGFTFNNPNASQSCGCGSSFTC